uniref:Uncharacterized protein n=1 Tax=Mesocestoides corti TaxID=53468 RepID=A0A5K3FSR9_MESCO
MNRSPGTKACSRADCGTDKSIEETTQEALSGAVLLASRIPRLKLCVRLSALVCDWSKAHPQKRNAVLSGALTHGGVASRSVLSQANRSTAIPFHLARPFTNHQIL